MPLVRMDYAVNTNEDWVDTFQIVSGDPPIPVDLTGSTFTAHVRRAATDLDTVIEASTANGKLVVSSPPSDGLVSWNVPREQLEILKSRDYVYDIVWTRADGREIAFAVGTIDLQLGVTR